jgi:ribosomal protein L19
VNPSSIGAVLPHCGAGTNADKMAYGVIHESDRKLEQEESSACWARKPSPNSLLATVIVNVNVVEGNRKRVQAYEGVVIAKRNRV